MQSCRRRRHHCNCGLLIALSLFPCLIHRRAAHDLCQRPGRGCLPLDRRFPLHCHRCPKDAIDASHQGMPSYMRSAFPSAHCASQWMCRCCVPLHGQRMAHADVALYLSLLLRQCTHCPSCPAAGVPAMLHASVLVPAWKP